MKRTILLLVPVLLLALIGAGIASAGSGRTVRTLGDEVMEPNVRVNANLRFSPGPLTASVGEEVTWVGADAVGAPHTVTLTRDEDRLMQDPEDLFFGACEPCNEVVDAAFAAHFATFPPTLEVGTADGFGDDGDSLLFGGGIPGLANEITAELTNVSPGETVFYFCAFHPWMQGSIRVIG